MDNTKDRSRVLTLLMLVLVLAIFSAIGAWCYRQTQLPPPIVRELRANGTAVRFFGEDDETDIWRDADIHGLDSYGAVDLQLLRADRISNLVEIHFDAQFTDLTPLATLTKLE